MGSSDADTIAIVGAEVCEARELVLAAEAVGLAIRPVAFGSPLADAAFDAHGPGSVQLPLAIVAGRYSLQRPTFDAVLECIEVSRGTRRELPATCVVLRTTTHDVQSPGSGEDDSPDWLGNSLDSHIERNDMTNEEFVRQAYGAAEVKDIAAWVACFNPDGVFVDESVGVTYRGPHEVGKPVENYGTAFSDMHRELYDVYVSGEVVVVELALQGTHDGPLWLPQGILPPTGKRMDAPCCDVFKLQNGRIQLFDCYPSGTVILGQLGVLGNLDGALQQQVSV